jgi:hypothetical protein
MLIALPSGVIILLDADDGGFAQLPGIPATGTWPIYLPLTLSPDGTQLLLGCEEGNGPHVSLVLQRLADGQRRRFPTPLGCFDNMAAFSPDGDTIASLANDRGRQAAIDLITVATRRPATPLVDRGPYIGQ